MNKKSIIRKSLAFVLLVIFTIGITPKNYWGKCRADHGDYTSASGDVVTVNKSGLDCHCDELVVSVPFTGITTAFHLSTPISYQEYSAIPYHFFYATTLSAKDSRGPPAVA